MNTFVIFVLSLVCLSQTAYSICPCMQGLMNTDLSHLSQRPASYAGSSAASSASSFAGSSYPGYGSFAPAQKPGGGLNLGGVTNGLGLTASGGLDLLGGAVKGAGKLGLSL